jgi:hypothetical protein
VTTRTRLIAAAISAAAAIGLCAGCGASTKADSGASAGTAAGDTTTMTVTYTPSGAATPTAVQVSVPALANPLAGGAVKVKTITCYPKVSEKSSAYWDYFFNSSEGPTPADGAVVWLKLGNGLYFSGDIGQVSVSGDTIHVTNLKGDVGTEQARKTSSADGDISNPWLLDQTQPHTAATASGTIHCDGATS